MHKSIVDWPSVTVGITTYNRNAEVLRAVGSVARQAYRGALEIIVVDDGSEKPPLLPKQAILVRHPKNLGIAAAKNSALTAGSGEIRGLLDSDDFYNSTHFVRRCVEELLANPSVGVVYTDNAVCDKNGRKIRVDRAIDWNLEAWLSTCNLRGDCWLGRWNVIRRTALHDERFRLEVDGDLFYQLAELTEFKRIPEALQTVTEHKGRTSHDYLEAAYWHAAGLAKYGHSVDYAFDRARRHNQLERWTASIEQGYAFGRSIREERQKVAAGL